MPPQVQIQFFINIKTHPGIRLRRLYEIEAPPVRTAGIFVGVNIWLLYNYYIYVFYTFVGEERVRHFQTSIYIKL